MRHHVFDLATGLLTGKALTSSDPEFLRLNTPEGCGLITGVSDSLSQRVDLRERVLVDYQPPSPGDEYVWDALRRRWLKRDEVLEREAKRAAALAKIHRLETQVQPRALREIKLAELNGDQPDTATIMRLERIDQQIAALREDLG